MTTLYIADERAAFRKPDVTVKAKARKRCPHCRKMIEKGDDAVLSDDRWTKVGLQWGGRSYVRGAWHLWHPTCHQEVGR